MAEISNKTLAFLLIGAIVLSLMGTLISLNRLGKIGVPVITGAGTSGQGTAQLEIASSLSISVVDDTVDFGSCKPGAGNTTPFDSNNTGQYGSGVAMCNGLSNPQNITIWNDGNSYVNLTIKTSNIDLTGGSNKSFFFAMQNATAQTGIADPGCYGRGELSWFNFTNTVADYAVCENFTYEGAKRRVWVFFRVWVPSDAEVGTKSATLTFTAKVP